MIRVRNMCGKNMGITRIGFEVGQKITSVFLILLLIVPITVFGQTIEEALDPADREARAAALSQVLGGPVILGSDPPGTFRSSTGELIEGTPLLPGPDGIVPEIGGGVLGCQTATSGGSLGNSLISGLLNRLPGNVSTTLPGTSRAVDRAVNAVPGISGVVAANSAGSAVNDALGGGAIGRAAGNVAGNLAGSVAYDIAGNVISGGGSGTLGSLNLSNLGSGLTNSLDRLGNRVAGSLTNALVSLPGFAGSVAANSAGNAVNDALGGGVLGNIAGSIAGDIAGNLANDIGNNLVGGALGSLGGGALGSLGGLSGALGPLGSIIGGGNVPVTDATAQKIQRAINADTRGIYGDTASLVRKECITDPLTRRIAQRMRTSITKGIVDRGNTGLNGGSYYVQPDYYGRIYNAANTNFISSLPGIVHPAYLQQTQTVLANNFQDETNPQRQLGCSLSNPQEFLENGTPQNGMDYWGTWLVTFQESGCTPMGAQIAADNLRRDSSNAQVEQAQEWAQQGGGYLPVTECLDGSGRTILEGCQNVRVVTPPSLVRVEYEGAIRSGEEDLAQVRETGEVIDALFAQLGQTALTSFSGALGLSRKKSTGTGSYLDQVTGTANTTSFTQAQNVVNADIEAALVVHSIYQSILEEILTNVKNTASAYDAAGACYATLGGSVSISPTVVTERIHNASTTVAILTPQINQKTTELERAKRTGSELQALLTQAGQARSIGEMNLITKAFDTLSASGALYNTTDATFLANDRDSSTVTLVVLQADATAQLAECKNTLI